MKNRLSDLNDHLFAQIERLSGDSMSVEDIETEAKRTQSIVSVANQIVGNADIQLKAAKLFAEHGQGVLPMLPQIGQSSKKETGA